MMKKWLLLILGIFLLACQVQANFQPVNVPLQSQNFTQLNISIRNNTDLYFWENFSLSSSTNTATVVLGLVKPLPSSVSYDQGYYYYVQAYNGSWYWIDSYNNTLGYLGRGLINASSVINSIDISILNNNITNLWLNASDQEGRLTTIEDILGVTFSGFGTLTNNKLCRFNSGDGKLYCDTSLPATYDDSALWANASDQQTKIQNILTPKFCAIGQYVNWTNGTNILCGPIPDSDTTIVRNLTAAQANITQLWNNASDQQSHITNLWTNASVQESRITSLFTNASIQESNIATLFSNDSTQETHITNLWSNASDQQSKINTLTTTQNSAVVNITALQKNITIISTNISALQTNVTNLWLNASDQQTKLYTNYTGTITGNVQLPAVNETYLNNTIDGRLSPIYYNATSAALITGTSVGSLILTQHPDGLYDEKTFNLTEAAGSPGLDARMNFTNVDSFNMGVMRYKTSSLSGEYPIIEVWNYVDEIWEDYPAMAQTLTFATITQPVFDNSEHILNKIVQMRLYKASNGNTNNHYYIDWVAISKGVSTPSGIEVDPLWTANSPNVYQNITDLWTNASVQESRLSHICMNGTSDLVIGNLSGVNCV